MKIEIENYKCPSWNDMQITHWAVRLTEKRSLQKLVYVYAYNLKKKAKVPATVTVEAHFKDGKRRDPDNLYVKPILDGLVQSGMLMDDNGDVIESITLIAKVKMSSDRILISINE